MENPLFKRQLSLPNFTIKHLSLLSNSCISIVGCGGLGCSAALYLTGAGIGKIIFVDGDTIDSTNLHRQIAYSKNHIGLKKVDILSYKCSQINTNIITEKYPIFLDDKNIDDILKESTIILDCTDNSSTRILLNDYCKKEKKPLIFGSALSYDGQLCTFDFRKINNKCLFCVFPDIEKVKDTCSSFGVLGPVPGIIGNLQSIECIKLITGLGTPLNDLLHYSSLDSCFLTIKTKECSCNINTINTDLEIDYKTYLMNKDKYILYDIRNISNTEDEETILDSIIDPNITLEKIDTNKNIVIICDIGERSKDIVKEWRNKGFKNCWSVKNGFRGI